MDERKGFRTHDKVIKGIATYRGRYYFLLYEGETKHGYGVLLAFLNGANSFWVKDPGRFVEIVGLFETKKSMEEVIGLCVAQDRACPTASRN